MPLRRCVVTLFFLAFAGWTQALLADEPDSVPSPGAFQAPSEHSTLKLIPWPKYVAQQGGSLVLTDKSHIVAGSPELEPLAQILSDDVYLVTGLRLKVAKSETLANDIVLRVNPALHAGSGILTVLNRQVVRVQDYADEVSIGSRIMVQGWDYRAVAEGTATLLQLFDTSGGKVTLPMVEIHDWPQADFMGAMVDTARQFNSIDDLKKMVVLCHVYKARYLDLHLTDDQGWTFPSTAYPQLGTQNTAAHGGPVPQRYDLDELKGLVKFADERGVTLVPKIEMPGHSNQAQNTLPEIFGYIDPATGQPKFQAMMDIANPKLYPALDTLIGEVIDVFKSSPYFDMGFDEVSGLQNVISTPQGKAFMKEHGLANGGDLVNYFALTVNDMVKKRGRKTLQWEGAGMYASKDIIVFTWDDKTGNASRLLARGIPTITVPWNLGVPWPQWSMFVCNGAFLKRNDLVLGACLPAWEQRGDVHVKMLYSGLPMRQERTWGPDNLFTVSGFRRREEGTDAVVDRLFYGFSIKMDGPVQSDLFTGDHITKSVKLTLSPAPGVGIVHYTTDGTEPTGDSPAFPASLAIDDAMTIKARLFDEDGKPIGDIWQQVYAFDPLTAKATNLMRDGGSKEASLFAKTTDVTLESGAPGGSIHYTTDGSDPVASSPKFQRPITLDKSTTIKARWFDAQDTGHGNVLTLQYGKFYGLRHAAVGKPVTLLTPADMGNKSQVEKLLTDGLLMSGKDANVPEVANFANSDLEAVIDMQQPTRLQSIGGRFLFSPEDGIYPPATLEVSVSNDNKTYRALGIARFTMPANSKTHGVIIKVIGVDGANVVARYVKIHATNGRGLVPLADKGSPAQLMCDELFVNPTQDPTNPQW